MRQVREWVTFWVLAIVLWGPSFLLIKVALRELEPVMVVALRISLGAAGCWAVLLWQRIPLPSEPRLLLALVLFGLVNTAAPFLLITWAEQFIDSGVAGILNGTMPFFTTLIAHFFLADDRITPLKLLGLALGFAGMVFLVGGNLQTANWLGSLRGQLAVIVACVCYACGAVYNSRALRGQRPEVVAAFSLTGAAAWLSVAAFVSGTELRLPASSAVWLAVLWLGLMGTALAYTAAFYLMRSWGPTRVSLLTYVLPVVAVTLGVVFLGEALHWQLVAGGLLVLAGIAVVNLPRSVAGRTATARSIPASE